MKIALIEISTSHEECLYSQLKFLTDAGHQVDLMAHSALESQIRPYANLAHDIAFLTPVKKGNLRKLRQQLGLLKKLKTYDRLIFNTASSSKMVRNLNLLLLGYSVKCIGLLHNGKKLESSFTQRLISLKIKKYLVLSDRIATNIKDGNKRISSFYPIFFSKFQKSVTKPEEVSWIAIPGRIDWNRRDYDTLLNVLKKSTLQRTKFLLMGRLDKTTAAGKKLWNLIQSNGVEHYFLYFDQFIANADFHGMLEQCDYVMPLLKKDTNYFKYKIAGSLNLAYAYKKTILSHAFFEPLEDLKENALFYDNTNLDKLLLQIEENKVVAPKGYLNPKWDYRFQKEKYLDFVLS